MPGHLYVLQLIDDEGEEDGAPVVRPFFSVCAHLTRSLRHHQRRRSQPRRTSQRTLAMHRYVAVVLACVWFMLMNIKAIPVRSSTRTKHRSTRLVSCGSTCPIIDQAIPESVNLLSRRLIPCFDACPMPILLLLSISIAGFSCKMDLARTQLAMSALAGLLARLSAPFSCTMDFTQSRITSSRIVSCIDISC